MEMILFMVLIAASSVFVMMSLGYSGKGGESKTEYHRVEIKTGMGYETAKKLLNDIKEDIRGLELGKIGIDFQITHEEYDGDDDVSKKSVGKRLKRESNMIPDNLEKLYDRKEKLEEIIKDYENIISKSAGDAQKVFNLNPVPA